MVKLTTRADPRKPGRPKKGEEAEDRVDMHVKVSPEFKRRFDKAAKELGQGITYEKRKALDDRLAILEGIQSQVAESPTPYRDQDSSDPDPDDDPEEKAGWA